MLDDTERFTASPAAVAARVRKTASLQTAEIECAGARKRHAALVAAIREQIAAHYGRGDNGATQIKPLEKERLEIEQRLRPKLARLHALRVEHAAKVSSALAGAQAAAASRLLAACGEIRAAIALLDESTTAIAASGGEYGSPPLLTFVTAATLGELEMVAGKLKARA